MTAAPDGDRYSTPGRLTVMAAPATPSPAAALQAASQQAAPQQAPTGSSRRVRSWSIRGLAIAIVLIMGAAAGCATERPSLDTSATLPPTTVTGEPVSNDEHRSLVAEATVEGDLVFREAPRPDADVVATVANPRQLATTPPVSIPLVMLVAIDAGEWLQVYLPIRPNGSTGWIPRDQVSISSHRWRIEAILDEFRLRVLNDGVEVFATDIGVARDNAPTPGGLYYTTELVRPPDPFSVYGTYAYGLSGFSDTFEEFNGGPGQLGVHGTNEPELIGQAVSAGCIRLRNEDIDFLVEELRLPLGVPVEVITTSG